jgi:hypothetical protein
MHVCACAWVLHTAAKSRANVSSSLRISRISSPSMMVSLVMGEPPGPRGVDEERTCTASDGVNTVPLLPPPCAVAMVHVRRTRQQRTSTQPCVCEARELGWVWAISRNKSTCTRDTHRVLLFSSVAYCSCVQLQRTLGDVRPRRTIQAAAEFKPCTALHAHRFLCGSLGCSCQASHAIGWFGQCALPVAKPLPSASVHPFVRQHAWGSRGVQGCCERPRALRASARSIHFNCKL